VSFEFRVLGPVEVIVDGRPVPLGGQKPLIVLAGLLLRANQVVAVGEIARWFCGEDDRRHSKGALQTYVLRVRRALGEPAPPRTERGGYLLRVDEPTLDVARFRRLADIGTGPPSRAGSATVWTPSPGHSPSGAGPALSNMGSDLLLRDEASRWGSSARTCASRGRRRYSNSASTRPSSSAGEQESSEHRSPRAHCTLTPSRSASAMASPGALTLMSLSK
jgi:hypothetical protein